MGVIITSMSDSFKFDLNGTSSDRAFARIKYDSIRSLVKSTDDKTVEFVFTDGEIHTMDYNDIEKIDGDTSIDSQTILYDKLEAKIFAP